MRPRPSRAEEAPAIALLGVELTRAELVRSALLFALMFLVALVFVVGRSARDALFLTKFPVTWIGPMWMAYGGASSVVALAYARYVDRLPRAQFVLTFAALAAATFVALRVLVGQELRAAYAALFVVTEILANLALMSAWTVAQELHDARSGKRLFGLIGSGRVVGVVVCGFLTGAVVRSIGTANLLLIVAAAFLGFGALAAYVARRYPAAPRAPDLAEHRAHASRSPLRSRYVLYIAALTLLVFAMVTIGDYQFKAIIQTSYPTRDELAGFMANFYGAIGLIGIVVQLVVTPRLLRRYGVLAGLLALPLAFSASSLGLLAVPGLAFGVLLKASDNGLQFTVHDASVQLLLFPFQASGRSRVRTFVDAIVKPLGCGVGAFALLFIAPRAGQSAPGPDLVRRAAHLGVWTIPIGAAIVLLVPHVRSGYVEAMRRTLVRRDLSPELVENSPSLRAMLREALLGPDAPQVLFAIEQLRALDEPALRDALPGLVHHASPRVRAVALGLACDVGDPRSVAYARAALDDPDADVRVAAIEALARDLREDAHDALLELADRVDDTPARAAAVAALVRSCGLDGMLDGAPRLRALLDSADPRDRVAAANVLARVGEASLQRALSRLIADHDPSVRRAAVDAASKVGDVRLVPQLVEAIATRSLASSAARALAALGSPAVPLLAAILADRTTPRAARLTIPRVLARIGTTVALDALLDRLDEPDEIVRQKVYASASRLRLALGAPPAPVARVRGRLDAEIAAHVATRDGYLAVRPLVQRRTLDENVVRRLRKGVIRVLRLCELAFPRATVALVRAHLFDADPAMRANAFEVLESLLDRRLREELVALVDMVLALRAGAFPPPRLQPREAYAATWLADEIARGEPYGAALALDAIAHHRIAAGGVEALHAMSSPDPLVREAASIAVASLKPAGYQRALDALLHDPDDALRAFANARYGAGHGADARDPAMVTTVEKILFLQRVPVFARIAGDDLVSLARGAVVLSMRKGDVVFRQGEGGGALYLVLSGRVALAVDGRVVADLGPNEVFGEMSIFDDQPRASTATLVDDAELLSVSADDFQEAVRDTVEIAQAVIQVLNRRLREADRRLAALSGQAVVSTAERTVEAEPRTPPADDRDLE
jgi:ATP/ADP translocase/HEAT repeat protein